MSNRIRQVPLLSDLFSYLILVIESTHKLIQGPYARYDSKMESWKHMAHGLCVHEYFQ